MTPESLIRRCHEFAGQGPGEVPAEDSLIGFFQVFRPDGERIAGLFEELSFGDALHQRLARLYSSAGDDRRPQGGRDAYFLIRNADRLEPEMAEAHAEDWIRGVRDIGVAIGHDELSDLLAPCPKFRVLEGIPPKHPKLDAEKSHLLRALQIKAASCLDHLDIPPAGPELKAAYYFIACDAMLRDYLMWPFYAEQVGLDDPLAGYFELWRHGVKYRIFGESQIDLYLPRTSSR